MEQVAVSSLSPLIRSYLDLAPTTWNGRQTLAEQQCQRKLTQLRQRKISTALKAESIERKLLQQQQPGHVEASYVGQLQSLREELARLDHSLKKLAQDVVENQRLQELANENRFGTLQRFRNKVQTRQLSVPEIIVTQSSCSVPSIPDSVDRESAVSSPKNSSSIHRSKWFFKWPSLADLSSGLLRPRSRSASCSKSYSRRHRHLRPTCNFSTSETGEENDGHSYWVVPLPRCSSSIFYTDELIFYDDKQAAFPTNLKPQERSPDTAATPTRTESDSTAVPVAGTKTQDKAGSQTEDEESIDPTALAEIAAFEKLIENYFHINARRRSFPLDA